MRVNEASLKPVDGLVWLKVALRLPAGFKINPTAPMRYKLTAEKETGPIDRAALGRSVKVDPPAAEFQIELPLTKAEGADTVDVTLDYYYCREGAEGVCRAGRTTWIVPVSLSAGAEQSTADLRVAVE